MSSISQASQISFLFLGGRSSSSTDAFGITTAADTEASPRPQIPTTGIRSERETPSEIKSTPNPSADKEGTSLLFGNVRLAALNHFGRSWLRFLDETGASRKWSPPKTKPS